MHITFVLIQLVVTVVLAIITVVTTLLQVHHLYFCMHVKLSCWPSLLSSPPLLQVHLPSVERNEKKRLRLSASM